MTQMPSIGDLFDLAKGRKAPETTDEASDGFQRYIQIDDLRPDATLKFAKDPNGTQVYDTDICIAWDGANAGTVSHGLTGIIGSTIARLRPRDEKRVFSPYVGRFLQGQFQLLNGSTTGATIPHVSKDRLLGLRLALPNHDEQRRIATLLDSADAIRRKRREALKLADEFLRSAFLDLFGDPVTNPKGWPKNNFGNLGTVGANFKLTRRADPKLTRGKDGHEAWPSGDNSTSGHRWLGRGACERLPAP